MRGRILSYIDMKSPSKTQSTPYIHETLLSRISATQDYHAQLTTPAARTRSIHDIVTRLSPADQSHSNVHRTTKTDPWSEVNLSQGLFFLFFLNPKINPIIQTAPPRGE